MNETLPGEIPAPDANVTEVTADSSTATETTAQVAADTGIKEQDVISPVQKRIDKLTWKAGEAERRAEAAERRARELEERLIPKQEQPAHKGPPTLAQFDYDEARYQAAFMEYVDARAEEKAQAAIRAERDKEKAEGRVKSFKEREAEFAKANPEYREKVYESEFMSIPITREVAELIAESPDGPGIALHLAENLDLARLLARLDPISAAKEVGKIEALLSKPKAPAPVVSKAPAPPPKVDAVEPDIKRDISDPELPFKEFVKIRRRQIAQRR